MSGADPGGELVAVEDHGTEDVRVADASAVRRGMGFAAGSFLANSFVSLCSAVLTARAYGIEVIGEFALVCAPWLTLIQFSSLGEQVAMGREVAVLPARDRRAAAVFFPVLAFSFLLTVAVAVPILLLGTATLRGPIDEPQLVLPAFVLAAAYILLQNTSWNVDALLAAYAAGRELFVARLTEAGGFLVLALLFRMLTDSVWGLTWATIASFAIALTFRLTVLPRYLTYRVGRSDLREGWHRLPRVLGFALWLVPGRFAAGITNQAGTWVLGAFGTTVAVGAFSRAANLTTRMNDASYRVGEILFPALVQRHQQGDREGFERILLRSLRPLAFGMLLLAAAGGGAAEGVMSVFGDGFGRAGTTLALLMLGTALWIVMTVTGQTFVAVGRPAVATSLSTLRMVSTVAAMIPATKAWGSEGVAGSLLFGVLVTTTVQGIWLRRSLLSAAATRALLLVYARALGAGAPAFLAALALDRGLPGVLGTGAGVVAGVAVYGAALYAIGGITADDRRFAVRSVTRLRTAAAARRDSSR